MGRSLDVMAPFFQGAYDSQQFSIIDFVISSVGEKVFEMKAHRCRSPLASSWDKTAPDAYFDASLSIWKGLVLSGIISTGSSVKCFFSSSNASWHIWVHSNFTFFFRRSLSGFAISEKCLINRR